MSMSIPIFFEPVVLKNRRSGQDHTIVDGALLSNFPIWLFDAPADVPPEFPTFGMMLVAPEQRAPLLPPPRSGMTFPDIGQDVEFLKAIVETMAQAHDRMYVEQANYARTIPIPTLAVKSTQFDITPAQTQELYDAGKTAAATFLETWNLEDYRERFRTGAVPPRRESVITRHA